MSLSRLILRNALVLPNTPVFLHHTPTVSSYVRAAVCSTKKVTNFEMALAGEKTDQYQRQFSSSPDSESNAAGLQNDKDHYAELVSSPDASTQDVSTLNHKK